MAEGQDESKKICVSVKTPKEKQIIEISEDADIKEVSTYIVGPRHVMYNKCDIQL